MEQLLIASRSPEAFLLHMFRTFLLFSNKMSSVSK